MNRCTLAWIKKVNDAYELRPDTVLDVGSRDGNGTPRKLFPDSDYVGIDTRNGPCVDVVLSAHELSDYFGEDHFDAVLALNVLEHIGNIWRVLIEISKVLKPKGYFYVAMPMFAYPRHDHPGDFWRATEQAVREVIMEGYDILSLEHAKTTFGKHPLINCLGKHA